MAAWFVRQIGQLYAVEKKLQEQKAGPALRQAMRVWQSQLVLNRLHRAMELIRRKTLPRGLLGQAIDYALKKWTALNQFISAGTLEIDNNFFEKCDSAQRTWKTQLAVYWASGSGRTQRGDLHPAGQLPAARD